jgi:tight adherence protein C
METAAALVLFVFLLAAISTAGYWISVRPGRLRTDLAEVIGERVSLKPAEPQPPAGKRIIDCLSRIGRLLPISSQDAELAGRYLVAAGWRSRVAVHVYLGIKAMTCVAFVTAALLFRDSLFAGNAVLRHLSVLAAAFAGFMLPNFVLEKLVARRQLRIRLALPDALDLLVVCVEAGLGLDQALVNVSRQMKQAYPDLSDELCLMTSEMHAGKRRSDALRNLATRTGEEDLRKLVAVLLQADRFGTSVADSLRTHSDFMRVRRKQIAEERAAKVGVKLVFPIFFFIMPSMMVVSIGPGLLQLMKNLVPMMRSVN